MAQRVIRGRAPRARARQRNAWIFW